MKYTAWSVSQLKKRHNKPWQGILKYKNAEGKWRNKSRVFPEAKGKKEAERLTEAWFDELNAENEKREEESYTLYETVKNYLELQRNKNMVEASSYYTDTRTIERFLKPYEIADIAFKEVDKRDLERWITQLHSKGYSQTTIHNTYKQVRKTYSYHLKMDDISKNPCVITVPKGKPKQSHMTQAQMTNFIKCVNTEYKPEDKMYVAIYLAYYGALRLGEICALRWRDIDFITNTISITSALGRTGEEYYTKGPKSQSSYRTFPLVNQLKEILLYRYNLLNPEPSWFVIGDEEEFITTAAISSNFKRFRNEYGLTDAFGRPLTTHLLRHNFGYWGARTVDISSLSTILGHATRAMTLNTYGSSDTNAVKMAIEQIGKEYSKTDLAE
jgi:integrase